MPKEKASLIDKIKRFIFFTAKNFKFMVFQNNFKLNFF